jgi:hypothetical protein
VDLEALSAICHSAPVWLGWLLHSLVVYPSLKT